MSNDLCRKLVRPLPKRGPKFVRRHTTERSQQIITRNYWDDNPEPKYRSHDRRNESSCVWTAVGCRKRSNWRAGA